MKDKDTLTNAEIIFTEVYFYIHGHACGKDVWLSALASWKDNAETMPMVAAAISAAKAIELGRVRRITEH